MQPALSVDKRFGRYTLLRQLAVGGMAEIYLARVDGVARFAKQVVLKRILPQFARHDEFVQMFLHEARLAAGLQHPNVVQVFDIGEVDGNYFFTMEYVQGDDLRSVLKATRQRGDRIPIQHAIAFIAEAAAGLHYAHEQLDADGKPLGIVHRDVSPSNIMVSFDGAVKVADFGIAKAASQTVETRTGMLKGKVSYMSPEQCRGDELDRRSDVFALGIVFHELVTGRKLFSADNDYAIIRKIVEQDAPAMGDGDHPPELEAIVSRALARDLDRRYPTAQALQVALEAVAREHRLDGSAVARSLFLRQILGTPPTGIPIEEVPSIAITVESVDTPTQEGHGAQTASTSIETPSSRNRLRPRRTRLIAGVGLAAALAATGVMIARRDDNTSTPTISPSTQTPARGPVLEPERTLPLDAPSTALVEDAAVAVPLDATSAAAAPTRDAGVAVIRTRAKSKDKPPKDLCAGWTPNSLELPPDGCNPSK